MKTYTNIFYFIAVVLLAAIIGGCDKPAPTELINSSQAEEDPVVYETIAKNPTDELYSNGADTTGISDNLTRYTNVIVVSGTKISDNSQTIKLSTAQAVFFDRAMPVRANGNLIGYQTQLLGEVKFNNVKALPVPFKVKFRNAQSVIQDSSLGLYHLLYSGRASSFLPFNYKYNSVVSFELNPLIGKTTSFDIPTPKEIFANLRITGSKANNNLAAKLIWDKGDNKTPIQIAISGKLKGKNNSIPLFKLHTRDDGAFIIPAKILDAIPPNIFDKLIITLIRQHEGFFTFRLNTLTVLSQSIHSLVVESP
jgi:hypothetical protein